MVAAGLRSHAASPALIAITSRPLTHFLFTTPEEHEAAPVVALYHDIHARWQSEDVPNDPASEGLSKHVTA